MRDEAQGSQELPLDFALAVGVRAKLERTALRTTGLVVVGGDRVAALVAPMLGCTPLPLDATSARAAEVVAAADDRLTLAVVAADGAIAAVARMRRLVPDRFAFAAALRLVVAGQVVRGLCRACRHPVQARGSVCALLGFDRGAIVHAAAGCEACGGSGQSGMVGIFEVIEVDAPMRRLIYDTSDPSLLARHAFLNAPDLGGAARALARDGAISAEEAIRVSRGAGHAAVLAG